MDRADARCIFLASLVLGAVLATLAMTGCGAPQCAVRAPALDGALRDQVDCEHAAEASSAPQATYDACLSSKGYP